MSKKKVVVIGAGFGGLSLALLLQSNGYHTTLIEAIDKLGGRGRAFISKGYDFEAGPTVITAPSLLDELYKKSNLEFSKEVELLSVSPFYELYFADGSRMKYFKESEKLLSEIEKISPNDVKNYYRFYNLSKKIYDIGFVELVKRPFLSYIDFFKQLPNLIRLGAYKTVYQVAKHYFKDDRLRKVFSFHTLLIGGNPNTTTSIYALIHALEREEGVFFVKGGTHILAENIGKNFKELGGSIMLNSSVEEILIEDQKIKGVKLRDGSIIKSDIVISNADITRTYNQFIKGSVRKDYNQKWFEKKKYTPGLFVTYFVVNKEYNELSHHNIIFCDRYTDLLKDIFEPNNKLTDDFSLYLHAPKRTDESRAPSGKDLMYVLSVVPNLKSSTDWDKIKEEYQNKILEELDKRVLPGLLDNLDFAVSYSPKDFDIELQSEWGSFASLQPTLFQSGPFRPHNKSHKIKGLYFVGAGTQPGAGIPGVISSGLAVFDIIKKDYND